MRNALILAAAIGVMAVVLFLVRRETSTPDAITAARGTPASSDAQARPGPSPGEVAEIHTDSPTPDYRSGLAASKDLWEFAARLLPAARAGEPAAQFYLSQALRYCDREYPFYFVRRNQPRTVDEAMQWASTRVGTSAEDARAVHGKCHRLQETPNDFGTADHWLAAAREQGFSLALIHSAHRLFADSGQVDAADPAQMRAEARRLAMVALRSKEPEVVFEMGDLVLLFTGGEGGISPLPWVWRLAACKRGFECGPDAQWYQFHCRFDANCQPYETGIDLIRRVNSADFDEIERRADEVNSRLDAGEIESWEWWAVQDLNL